MRIIVVAVALLPLAIEACTPVTPLPGVPTGECSTKELGDFQIGQYANGDVIERARRIARASAVRVLRPGQVVTMEYRNGRLNVNVDSQNRVRHFTCG